MSRWKTAGKAALGTMAGAMLTAMAGAAAQAAGEDTATAVPNPVAEWDALWMKTLIDITVIGVVFGVVAVWWLYKYRAKSPDEVGRGPKLTKAQAAAWALIPAAIFMADDFFLAAKGWSVWNTYRRVPDNALEIKATGYQWYWEFDYGDGVTSESLKVPVGRPVVLRMTSPDVIHSFYVPDYRVKEDVMPGRVTYIWFLPTEEKSSPALCTEFCGLAHSQMVTEVHAVPPDQFQAWLDGATKLAADRRAAPAAQQAAAEAK